MDLAFDNLQKFDMPLNKETKPNQETEENCLNHKYLNTRDFGSGDRDYQIFFKTPKLISVSHSVTLDTIIFSLNSNSLIFNKIQCLISKENEKELFILLI